MVSEREDDSCSGDHKQKWRPLSAPPCNCSKPLPDGLDLLKSKRICRSEPCIFLKEYRLSTAFQRLRRTRSRVGCRRTVASSKNEGIISVLRRRALSRHFSNSFASSLDISSASQNSSCGLYLTANTTTAHGALDCCNNVLQVLSGYSRSTSSGYASRRSSLSGSPFPGGGINGGNGGDMNSCTANWSDVSGNFGRSTPRSDVKVGSSLHSLIAGTIGDLESDVVVETAESLVGQLFAVRFPQLKRQMESRIRSLVTRMESDLDYQKSSLLVSDGTARFVYCHILEMAKDCLHRCGDGAALDVDYFNAVSDELQRMLRESKEKCAGSSQSPAIQLIKACVDEFLLAVARTADVLECLDSNPSEFYCALTAVENQLNVMLPDSRDIPRYVLSQLKTSISLNEQSVYARLLQDYQSASLLSNDASQPSSPPTIGDFNVLKRISAGSYGSVYLVQHKASGKYMALKRLSKRSVCRKNFIQQVFTERDILMFIQNPFVVSLLCSFETEHDLCLVMEYVEGGDVRSLLDYVSGPLSVDMATLYFAETTLAVEYIHSYGIVHRDIKPSNLLITAHGHIKLTDFGLSRIGLADLTSSQFHDNQVIGTPQYIAPEVILRTGYGQPVDWWSMGILLYEMLVGCTPFTADNVDALFELIVGGDVEWPEYLTGTAAKELIEMLLRRNPSQRPHYIRNHRFFVDIDWEQLLVRKATFVPVLESPDDTSYFRQNKTMNTTSATAENGATAAASGDDFLQHFYFSSYAPSFASSVSSSKEPGNLDSTSDSGGSLGSSLHNLSISPGNLADAETSPSPIGSRKIVAKPKGRRFRGSLLRARSFFLKRVLAADKRSNNLREICINRRQTDGYGFTFATYPSAKEQGRYVHQVLSVTSDGPAYKAGVRKGNTIVHINQKDVSGLTHTGVLRLVQRTKHVLHVDLSNDNYNVNSNNDCTDLAV